MTMKRMRTKGLRMGAMAICAMLLGAGSASAADRYEVMIFQKGGAPGLAELKPQALSVVNPNRAEIGSDVIYIETDQAGLARVHDDDKLAITGPMLIYKALGSHVPATDAVKGSAASLSPDAKGEPGIYYLFASLEPAEGKADTFNDFYEATHLPEIITVPGMQWAVRGRLMSQTPETFNAPRYTAIYQFKSHDLKATMDEVARRQKVGIVKPFPKDSVGGNVLVFYAGPLGAPVK